MSIPMWLFKNIRWAQVISETTAQQANDASQLGRWKATIGLCFWKSWKTRSIRPTMRPHDDGIIAWWRVENSSWLALLIFTLMFTVWQMDRWTNELSYRDAIMHLVSQWTSSVTFLLENIDYLCFLQKRDRRTDRRTDRLIEMRGCI